MRELLQKRGCITRPFASKSTSECTPLGLEDASVDGGRHTLTITSYMCLHISTSMPVSCPSSDRMTNGGYILEHVPTLQVSDVSPLMHSHLCSEGSDAIEHADPHLSLDLTASTPASETATATAKITARRPSTAILLSGSRPIADSVSTPLCSGCVPWSGSQDLKISILLILV